MAFQDVAFLFSWDSFSTKFLKKCDRGESLRTTACPKTVVGVSKGMIHVKYFRSNKSSFCVCRISLTLQGCHKDEVNLATLSFRDVTDVKE